MGYWWHWGHLLLRHVFEYEDRMIGDVTWTLTPIIKAIVKNESIDFELNRCVPCPHVGIVKDLMVEVAALTVRMGGFEK